MLALIMKKESIRNNSPLALDGIDSMNAYAVLSHCCFLLSTECTSTPRMTAYSFDRALSIDPIDKDSRVAQIHAVWTGKHRYP